MADFSQDIHNFRQNGTYSYEYDEVGNMTFNSSSADFSQVYVAFPLVNFVYNNKKVESFYNIEFEEFVPTTNTETTSSVVETMQAQLNAISEENAALKEQLDTVIAQNTSNVEAPNSLAIKQVILELRKSLGQGRVDSDFSEDFPYTPLRKVTK